MDKNRRKNAQKVIVAMSGGVDSSVAAALLKRVGVDELRSSSRTSSLERVRKNFNSFDFANARVFDVMGVFMKFWSAEPDNNNLTKGWNRCCSPDSEKKARQVAKILNIPFYVIRFEKEFKKRIVDYFLKEHRAGLTPNPCVICNKEIKFGLLLKKALTLNADFIATGHYARLKKTKDRFHLLQGKDKNKDQSYFLWQLRQKQLEHVLFPVGNYAKREVRKLAKKFKLPVLDIPESMEICFIKTTIDDFLKKHIKQRPGNIIDIEGKISGRHEGLSFYTIGQRKGIKLPGGPFYVLDKDFKKNQLIITKNEKDLYEKELIAKNINWISGKELKFPLKVKATIRYRHKASPATVYKIQNTPKENKFPTGQAKYKILFSSPQRAITPGQSVVFYRGQEVVGGGIIC